MHGGNPRHRYTKRATEAAFLELKQYSKSSPFTFLVGDIVNLKRNPIVNGGAPCVQDRLLSLAICKPMIRSTAEPEEDLIFGFAANSLHCDNRLIYIARIEEKVRNGDYYREKRFADRGDRVYECIEAASSGVTRHSIMALKISSTTWASRPTITRPTFSSAQTFGTSVPVEPPITNADSNLCLKMIRSWPLNRVIAKLKPPKWKLPALVADPEMPR